MVNNICYWYKISKKKPTSKRKFRVRKQIKRYYFPEQDFAADSTSVMILSGEPRGSQLSESPYLECPVFGNYSSLIKKAFGAPQMPVYKGSPAESKTNQGKLEFPGYKKVLSIPLEAFTVNTIENRDKKRKAKVYQNTKNQKYYIQHPRKTKLDAMAFKTMQEVRAYLRKKYDPDTLSGYVQNINQRMPYFMS